MIWVCSWPLRVPTCCLFRGSSGAAPLCRPQRTLQLHAGSLNESPEESCSDLTLPGVYKFTCNGCPFLSPQSALCPEPVP